MTHTKNTSQNKLEFVGERKDLEGLKHSYRETGRVHITEFLEPQSASEIHQALEQQQEWNLVWNDQGKHSDLSYTGVLAWTDDQKSLLRRKIHTQAERDFQYHYSAIPIFDIYRKKLMPGHFFNQVYELFNDPKLIRFVREVTGHDAITYADMQATRYSKGHFLAEHDDNVQFKNRLAAYVLNLTPEWKSDWGGALVFPEYTAHEATALFPKFNALNIFSVPQKHSVSFVTPFAGAHRYAITGWFRY